MAWVKFNNTDHKLWDLVKKAVPGYKKKSATLVPGKSVHITGNYWDGGSISRYYFGNTLTGKVIGVSQRNDFPFTAPDDEIVLTDDHFVVQCGIFCGKPGGAYLHVTDGFLAKHKIRIPA
jgi:hypothetical protein